MGTGRYRLFWRDVAQGQLSLLSLSPWFLFIIGGEYVYRAYLLLCGIHNIRHQCMPWVWNTELLYGVLQTSENYYSRDTIQLGFKVNGGPWSRSGWHPAQQLLWVDLITITARQQVYKELEVISKAFCLVLSCRLEQISTTLHRDIQIRGCLLP